MGVNQRTQIRMSDDEVETTERNRFFVESQSFVLSAADQS